MPRALYKVAPVVLALAACAPLRPLGIQPPASTVVRATGDVGSAVVAIRWPDATFRRTQTIPFDSTSVRLQAVDASGSVLASTTLTRSGSEQVSTASLDVPVGAGRVIEATLDAVDEQRIAFGKSEAFSVRRNQSVPVSIGLEPLIHTIAGPGTGGLYTGADVSGTQAVLGSVSALSFGLDGTLYFADFNNHAIRAVMPGGTVRLVVGQASGSTPVATTVSPDNSGEGRPASDATSDYPKAVYVAPDGDLFLVDVPGTSGYSRVRMVAAQSGPRYGLSVEAGHVYTLWTTKTAALQGIVKDRDGALLITQPNGTPRVWRLDTAGTASVLVGGGSAATDSVTPDQVLLSQPWGLSRDNQDNLLISQRIGHRIRMLCRTSGHYYGMDMTAGLTYTIFDATVANFVWPVNDPTLPVGQQTILYPQPCQMALDREQNLLFIDANGSSVYRLDRVSGAVSRVAGGTSTTDASNVGDDGPATNANFSVPTGLAIDGRGRLFIGDSLNHRIREIHL